MRNVPHPTSNDLDNAHAIIREYLLPTPLLQMDQSTWLKLETQQPVGSFKIRGAVAALARLESGSRVVTASAGNHALGIAWAARQLNIEAIIVVPTSASPRKLELLEDMGANIVKHGGSFDDAEAHALSLAADGCHFISAYNDPHVIAGQASIIDELAAEVDGDFTVVAPVGGGGLVAGLAIGAARVPGRTVRVVGVEAKNSPAMSAAVAAGHAVRVDIEETLADGLAGNLEPGSTTVEIISRQGVPLLSVSEEQIADAIRDLYVQHDIVAEGAAAVTWAAMHQHRFHSPVIGIITGRNIPDSLLQRIVRGQQP